MRLRASLRAAMRLERLHHGFPTLFRKIEEFDTQTIRTVISTAATDPDAADRLLDTLPDAPLKPFRLVAQSVIASLCAAFFPADTADKPDTPSGDSPAKPVPWSEAYADLFRIGTGWLGWTPSETWAATPTEIVQALEGKVAHLIAMNGGAGAQGSSTGPDRDQREANIAAGLDPEFDRAGLMALKAMT